jgi:hypothetical protein
MKAEPDRPRARTCSCGARYETEAFAKLPQVRTLEAAELATFMVAWPATMAVRHGAIPNEVRDPICHVVVSGRGPRGRRYFFARESCITGSHSGRDSV